MCRRLQCICSPCNFHPKHPMHAPMIKTLQSMQSDIPISSDQRVQGAEQCQHPDTSALRQSAWRDGAIPHASHASHACPDSPCTPKEVIIHCAFFSHSKTTCESWTEPAEVNDDDATHAFFHVPSVNLAWWSIEVCVFFQAFQARIRKNLAIRGCDSRSRASPHSLESCCIVLK